MADDLLSEFLRARRARLRPADVGLPERGQRRVPGLRREEVALLAGVSADYYLRLEQGRGGQPSEQVLRSLARVLQLDDAGTAYLLSLVAPQPAAQHRGPEQVPPSVRMLLGSLALPAGVFGRTFDVLASNAAARALTPELTPGRNRLRSLFLVEAERALYGDWEPTAARYVAIARDALRRNATDPDFVALVQELESRSPRFRALWARYEVVAWDSEAVALRHPRVGALRMHLERFDVPGGAGQSLFIGHPADTDTAARLAALAQTGEDSNT